MNNIQYNFNNKILSFNTPKIMGIVNVTPDSFSDGGKYFSVDDAVNHALKLLMKVQILLILEANQLVLVLILFHLEEELRRTIPVIKNIRTAKKRFNHIY